MRQHVGALWPCSRAATRRPSVTPMCLQTLLGEHQESFTNKTKILHNQLKELLSPSCTTKSSLCV